MLRDEVALRAREMCCYSRRRQRRVREKAAQKAKGIEADDVIVLEVCSGNSALDESRGTQRVPRRQLEDGAHILARSSCFRRATVCSHFCAAGRVSAG